MHRLTFLRHGQSTGNLQGLIQGQQDYPLTPAGIAQAQALAARWQAEGLHFDAILSSPLERALTTARTVAQALEACVEVDAVWLERSFGQIEGRPFAEIASQGLQHSFFDPFTPAGQTGESLTDVYRRATLGVQGLLQRPPGAYLVVSHGAMLNQILFVLMGLSPLGHAEYLRFSFGNTAYAQLDYQASERRWYLRAFVNPTDGLPVDEEGRLRSEGTAP